MVARSFAQSRSDGSRVSSSPVNVLSYESYPFLREASIGARYSDHHPFAATRRVQNMGEKTLKSHTADRESRKSIFLPCWVTLSGAPSPTVG